MDLEQGSSEGLSYINSEVVCRIMDLYASVPK